MAMLPSADSATDMPWRALPTAPVLTSLLPCCIQTPPLRVNTHAAPGPAHAAARARCPTPPIVGSVADGGTADVDALPRRHARSPPPPSAAAAELIALLRPNPAAAGEHPRRPRRLIVARPAHDGGVAVARQGDRRTLGPQSPSIFAGGADQLVALLPPGTAAARDHPPRPTTTYQARP